MLGCEQLYALPALGDGPGQVSQGIAMGDSQTSTVSAHSRTASLLNRLREQEGRPALVGYLPLGFPDLARTMDALYTLADSGVDIIELGIPHTAPAMDGIVIQQAVQVALEAGTRSGHLFGAVRRLREHAPHVEVLVMTYWDPIRRYGVNRFAHDLAAAGGAGLITPDLDPNKAGEWIAASDQHGLDRVFLVAPSAHQNQLDAAARSSRGFVYAASTVGVTGARTTIGEKAEQLVKDTRAAGATEVCVGLGVSTGDQAAEVGRWADGVIVGSVMVRALQTDEPWETNLGNLATITRELADGVRRARPQVPATLTTMLATPDITAKGTAMPSTMSMPGNDEQIRDEVVAAILEGTIEDAEVPLVHARLDERPGRYQSLSEILAELRGAPAEHP
jgi:tryptophan synthase alpha chain